ncbi:MAG: DUF6640 family protein [Pseudomonadota bacterium]
MRISMRLLIKCVLTAATAAYGFAPIVADLNETHLFNPDWSPHARMHGAWLLFSGACIAGFSLFKVWVHDQLVVPSVVGLLFVSGFWLATLTAPFYEGALVDDNGFEDTLLSFNANVLVFLVVTATLVCVLIYAVRSKSH